MRALSNGLAHVQPELTYDSLIFTTDRLAPSARAAVPQPAPLIPFGPQQLRMCRSLSLRPTSSASRSRMSRNELTGCCYTGKLVGSP